MSVVVSDTSPLHYLLGKLQQTNARLDPELVRAAVERDAARQEHERAETQARRTDPQP